MEQQHALGLPIYGEFVGSKKMRMLLLIMVGVYVALCQFADADPTIKQNGQTYDIGPYPIQISQDGVNLTFMTWLHLTPIVIRKKSVEYELSVGVTIDLTPLQEASKLYAQAHLPTDNCAHKGVDNWVYNVGGGSLTVSQDHNLALAISGDVSTWSCATNPFPETRCGHYKDSLGIEWPENCKTEQGPDIKNRNFQQGFQLYKNFTLDTTKVGDLSFSDPNPLITFTGNSTPSQALNVLALFEGNLTAIAQQAFMSPKIIKAQLPGDWMLLKPRFDDAGFTSDSGHIYLNVYSSVRVSLATLNAFMAKHVGSAWVPLLPDSKKHAHPHNGPVEATISGQSDELVSTEQVCGSYRPSDSIERCAKRLGLVLPAK